MVKYSITILVCLQAFLMIAKAQVATSICRDDEIKVETPEGERFCVPSGSRRLVSSPELWDSIDQNCNTQDYKLSLYVKTHAYLIATPYAPLACPTIIMDVKFGVGKTEATKMVSIFDETEMEGITNELWVSPADAFPFQGEYSLQNIHTAFESAKAKEEGVYDFFSNNCGVFIKDILDNLEMEWTATLTKEVKDYAVGKLMKEEEVVHKLAMVRGLGVNMEFVAGKAVEAVFQDV